MKKSADIQAILTSLKTMYPDAHCTLTLDDDPFHLIVRALLSAQCTDVRVNEITKLLFEQYPTANDLAEASEEKIGEIIYTLGLWRNKAKSVSGSAKLYVTTFHNTCPKTREELMMLPGVGRKVANLILAEQFRIPAIVVDTHCSRVANRLGLSDGNTPIKIEKDLMKQLPEEEWATFSHRMVAHGRALCYARVAYCDECSLAPYCSYALSNRKKGETK